MNSGTLELAFLYEISSFAGSDSEMDIFDEVVEKAVRLFGVCRVALILYADSKGEATYYTWGFAGQTGEQICHEQLRRNWPSANVYVRELGNPLIGMFYLEKQAEFTDDERRLLDVFSGRLANILQVRHWEEKARKLSECFKLVIENTPMVGVCAFDREGTVLHYNQEAQRIFSWNCCTSSNVPGSCKDWSSQIKPTADFEKLLAKVWETGQASEPSEWLVQTPQGKRRWVFLTLVPITQGQRVSEIFSMVIDITERKRTEEELRRLSFFDNLTGVYNRNHFEQKIRQLDADGIRPVSIIVCDVDGLKLVNDSIGHKQGDELLQQAATVINKVFPKEMVFRTGGDEFAVILPGTNEESAQKACTALTATVREFNKGNTVIPLSLSVGVGVTENRRESVYEAFRQADDRMYRDKLQRGAGTRSSIIQSLMAALNERDFVAEGHIKRVQELVLRLGKAVGLSKNQMNDLLLLAQMHDIGKVGIPDHILFKNGPLMEDERKEMKRHCEIGYRIARCSTDLAAIAELILQHHEWWNGQGYPRGLKGEEIHICSRILAIADAYDAMTSDRPYRKAISKEEALAELKKCAGTQFDPHLVEIFVVLQERDAN